MPSHRPRSDARRGAGPEPPAITVLWEFRVLPARAEEFERHYGTGGSWARLFQRSEAYLGTVLLRDRADHTRYLTADTWSDEAGYRGFHEAHAADYAALDAACGALTTEERLIGVFQAVSTGAP